MSYVSFDPVAKVYDETRDRATEAQLNSLLEELNGTGRILDVGVGTGRFALPLQKQGGRDLVGVDVSNGMLARAKQKRSRELGERQRVTTPIFG